MVSKLVPQQARFGNKMMKSLSTDTGTTKKQMTKAARKSALKLQKMLLMSWLFYVHDLSMGAKAYSCTGGSKTIRPADVEKAETDYKQVFEENLAAEEEL